MATKRQQQQNQPDLYKILGVPINATPEQIKDAYRRLVKEHHPDNGGSPEKFRAVHTAYEVLSDPERRRLYDRTGDLGDLFIDDTQVGGAERIVKLVKEAGVELFHDDEPIAYVSLEVDGHRETWPLKSTTFKRWVQKLAYDSVERIMGFAPTGWVPSAQEIKDALGTLEAIALFDGETISVYVRLAPFEDAIYLDLCDDDWQSVRISPSGWSVVKKPPVRFRRAPGMKALPAPEHGGSLDELREFLNVGDDEFRLVAGWLVSAFHPEMPYPVLALHGEQGSAKSTAARVLRELIDPNKADLRRPVRETRDLVIAANNGWVITLDNLSKISQGVSDDLCRLATGGGFSTRTLYTNEEETIFESRRPVILTAIEEVATSGDLLDRVIMVKLPPIPKERRREEDAFWQDFESARPRILGALLDGVSAALKNLPTTKLDHLPRMADMARFVTAAESGLRWEAGSFLRSYYANRDQTHELAIEASLLGPVLLKTIGDDGFLGNGTELLDQLNLVADERTQRDRDWPKTARGLRSKIDRLAPDLRGLGFTVDLNHREGHTGKRLWRIDPPDYGGEDATVTSVTSVTGPMAEPDSGDGRGDGVADEGEQPSPQKPLVQASGDDGDGGDGLIPTSSIREFADGDLCMICEERPCSSPESLRCVECQGIPA
jgi:hypothetical protein